jgi:hypothetical protein
MTDLYQLLKKIEKRPSLYIGKKSIFNLQSFLDGYYFARRELQIPLSQQEDEFQDFLQWIRETFNIETGQLWSSIILFHSADESNAVERFFSLFDEFISNHQEQKQKMIIYEINQ